MLTKIIIIVIAVIFARLSAGYDHDKYFSNHTPRFIFRSVVGLLIAWLVGGFDFNINLLKNWLGFGMVFYAFFDYIHNYLKGFDWTYIGQTANTDRFLRWINIKPRQILIIKISLIIIYTII